MKFIRGFGRFWYDLIIGDDWKIAMSVVITLALGTGALLVLGVPSLVLTPVLGLALMAAFAITLGIDVRERRPLEPRGTRPHTHPH